MNENDQQASAQLQRRSTTDRLLVVAIAGSDTALMERLVRDLPSGRNMAFLLVGVSAPSGFDIDHVRQLTSLSVAEVVDDVPLKPDTIYVCQPGQSVECHPERLIIQRDTAGILALDQLFRGLAQHHAERSAAVLLAGLRSEGSVGASEMKAAGALVILQAPGNSAEANLPEQLLLTKVADLVLPLPRVVGALLDYFEPSRSRNEDAYGGLFDTDTLAPILNVLIESSGHDFTRYKRSTVSRRIQRRMRVHGLEDPSSYVELLMARPAEAELLFNEMLIGVTNFFRDPEAFAVLARALDEYLLRVPPQQELRVWVPACSTGEKAYSSAAPSPSAASRAPSTCSTSGPSCSFTATPTRGAPSRCRSTHSGENARHAARSVSSRAPAHDRARSRRPSSC